MFGVIMKESFTVFWAILLTLCLFVALASSDCLDDDGQHNKVTVSSSTAGTQVVSSINGGCTVYVEDGSVGGVWVSRTKGTCSTTLTDDSGIRLSRDSGDPDPTAYDFIPKIDGYLSQLCAILESGSTAIDLCVNCW